MFNGKNFNLIQSKKNKLAILLCKHVQFDSPNLKIHQFWVKYIWNIFRFIEDLERISSRLGPVIRSTTDFNTQICIQDEIGFSTPLKKNKGKTKLFISPAPNKNVAEHKLETATSSEEKDEQVHPKKLNICLYQNLH